LPALHDCLRRIDRNAFATGSFVDRSDPTIARPRTPADKRENRKRAITGVAAEAQSLSALSIWSPQPL